MLDAQEQQLADRAAALAQQERELQEQFKQIEARESELQVRSKRGVLCAVSSRACTQQLPQMSAQTDDAACQQDLLQTEQQGVAWAC